MLYYRATSSWACVEMLIILVTAIDEYLVRILGLLFISKYTLDDYDNEIVLFICKPT